MNRKLIRTTLAEVKGRGDTPQHKERERGDAPVRSSSGGGGGGGGDRGGSGHAPHRGGGGGDRGGGGSRSDSSGSSASAAALGRKRVPPSETNAEIFYYKKQMDAHTLMVMVLLDGEEIEGTIEWYDRAALKVNRKGEPNILLLKHNIKYMYKAEDRDGGGSGE